MTARHEQAPRVVGAAILLTLALAPIATAQVLAVRPCSFDTAALTVPDSVVVGLAAANASLTPSEGPSEAVVMAEAIARFFVAPAAISLPFWARVFYPPEPGAPRFHSVGSGLDDFIELTLQPNGRLGREPIDIRTASPEFNAALVAAIRAADSASAFPAPGAGRRRAGGRITLRLVNLEHVLVPSFPLMKVRTGIVRADRPPKVISQVPPSYPRNALRAGAQDSVVISYVVSEEGRVDPRAPFHLVHVTWKPFADAVVAVLPQGRFEPATIGGCPVPMLVVQPFMFAIRR